MFARRHSTWLVASLLILYARPVLAYLDPASGSLLLQTLLAGLLAALVVLKTYWRRMRSWFGHKPHEQNPAPTRPDSEL